MNENPILYLARRAWGIAGDRRRLVVLYLSLFACAQAVMVAEPYVIARLLNAVQTEADPARLLGEIRTGALLFVLVQVVFWMLHGPARVVERRVAFHIRTRMRASLMRVATELPLQWHRESHSGDTIDRMSRATSALFEFSQGSFMLVYMLLRLAFAELILLWFLPAAGIAAAVTTGIVFCVVFGFDRVLYRHYRELNGFEHRVASAVHDYVTNMATVLTLRLESRVLRETVRRMMRAYPTFGSNTTMNELKWFLTSMMIALMIGGVLAGHAYTTLAAGLPLLGGTLFALFEYLRRIADSFYEFAMLYGNTVRQAADVRAAEAIERAHAELVAGPAALPLPAGWRRLTVTGLHFTYRDEKERAHHLRDVRVELARGRSVALVGPSGSGKSTLLALLRGLQTPDSAELVCDGIPLEGGLRRLAACTMLVPQSPEIFADTVRFNITFGLEAEETAVADAVEAACFEQVLRRLPGGLETDVTERGVNLSGGERQRLALARGVFFSRESEIVLLDEPTSSVDPLAERRIYEDLLARFADRSIVSTVHKLHLLPLFDEVYVLDDGRIVEQGSFADLVDSGGLLSRLWESYQADAPPDRRRHDSLPVDAIAAPLDYDLPPPAAPRPI